MAEPYTCSSIKTENISLNEIGKLFYKHDVLVQIYNKLWYVNDDTVTCSLKAFV